MVKNKVVLEFRPFEVKHDVGLRSPRILLIQPMTILAPKRADHFDNHIQNATCLVTHCQSRNTYDICCTNLHLLYRERGLVCCLSERPVNSRCLEVTCDWRCSKKIVQILTSVTTNLIILTFF
jgi:hypothetical protein